MMLQEFKNKIIESAPQEWTYDDEMGLYVFEGDISITIEAVRNNDEDDSFFEPWVETYPDTQAYRKIFNLRYNGSTIEQFYTAAVDGYRMYIPYPRRADMTISQEQYRIGLVINQINTGYSMEDYLSTGGITVRPELTVNN
ncbi:hypothetical protein [Priestia sp. TGN 0903]|uniref:hypothetical protein n=1 Tax=Priestia sp. TGN 0903 TaxID=3420730 RepID=UPI003D7876D0